MILTIVIEARFIRTPDQKIWSNSNIGYEFWERYLKVFNSVRVVARIKDVLSVDPSYKRIDSNKVVFVAFPYYIGPFEYILHLPHIYKISHSIIKDAEAIILRIPGQVSAAIYHYIKKYNCYYAVEVVGDPYDVFSSGSIRHPLRRIFQWIITKQFKEQCINAGAASYVTKLHLQNRYPTSNYHINISSIDLNPADIKNVHRYDHSNLNKVNILTIGSLEQLYKGIDVLLNSLYMCIKNGMDVELKIAGEGRYRQPLEQLASKLKISDKVIFLGMVPAGQEIINLIDKADLFVLPSKTEGLPRALIEAMTRGTPCIGSRVGGIPELLEHEDMVEPNNALELARKIEEVINDMERLQKMSLRNFEKSKEYSSEILNAKRMQYYTFVKNESERRVTNRRKPM